MRHAAAQRDDPTPAPDPTAQPLRVLVTSGGLLWRRRAGEIEVCLLSPDLRRWVIPRGRVHEDERLEEAAVRTVHDLTGHIGRAGRPLARAASADGEVSYLFLLRCAGGERFVNPARKAGVLWTSIPRAYERLASSTERAVLRRAALALTGPVEPALVS